MLDTNLAILLNHISGNNPDGFFNAISELSPHDKALSKEEFDAIERTFAEHFATHAKNIDDLRRYELVLYLLEDLVRINKENEHFDHFNERLIELREKITQDLQQLKEIRRSPRTVDCLFERRPSPKTALWDNHNLTRIIEMWTNNNADSFFAPANKNRMRVDAETITRQDLISALPEVIQQIKSSDRYVKILNDQSNHFTVLYKYPNDSTLYYFDSMGKHSPFNKRAVEALKKQGAISIKDISESLQFNGYHCGDYSILPALMLADNNVPYKMDSTAGIKAFIHRYGGMEQIRNLNIILDFIHAHASAKAEQPILDDKMVQFIRGAQLNDAAIEILHNAILYCQQQYPKNSNKLKPVYDCIEQVVAERSSAKNSVTQHHDGNPQRFFKTRAAQPTKHVRFSPDAPIVHQMSSLSSESDSSHSDEMSLPVQAAPLPIEKRVESMNRVLANIQSQDKSVEYKPFQPSTEDHQIYQAAFKKEGHESTLTYSDSELRLKGINPNSIELAIRCHIATEFPEWDGKIPDSDAPLLDSEGQVIEIQIICKNQVKQNLLEDCARKYHLKIADTPTLTFSA